MNNKKFFLFLGLVIWQSCSNVRLIEKNDHSNKRIESKNEKVDQSHSQIAERIKLVKQLKSEGRFDEAKKELNSWRDLNLNSDDQAIRDNLFGTIYFSEGNFEAAIKSFRSALIQPVSHGELQSLIRLNLASSEYKVNDVSLALQDFSMVQVDQLGNVEKAKYYQLKYILYKSSKNVKESLTALINYFGLYETIQEIESDALLDDLYNDLKKLNKEEKWNLFLSFQESKFIVIPLLVNKEIEELKLAGDEKLIEQYQNWLKLKFSDIKGSQSTTAESSSSLMESYSLNQSLNLKKIGLLLPTKGAKSKYAERSSSSIKLAIEHFNLIHANEPNRQLDLIIKENNGGGEQLKEFIENLSNKENVGMIIGGLFPEEAKNEYLECKKRGIFYLSLSPVYLPRKEKDFLLLEVTPSVQSILKQLFNETNLGKLGKRGAIFYPDDLMGKSYFLEFWDEAQKKGIEIKAIQPFNRQEKDLSSSIKKFLDLEFIKEREEEKKFMDRVYLSGYNNIKRIQTLPPYQNYDWIFLPIIPEDVERIIPSFFYFELNRMHYIGIPSWRSKSVQKLSERVPLIFFDNNALVESSIKNVFWSKKQIMPGIVEYNSFLSIAVVDSMLNQTQNFATRTEYLNWLTHLQSIKFENESWTQDQGTWPKDLKTFKFYQGNVVESL